MGKFRSPWKKPTTIMIAIFLIVLFWMFTQEAKADTSVEITAGMTAVGGERYDSEAMMITESWNEGKYELGALLQLRLDCSKGSACGRGEADSANQAVFLQRVVYNGGFHMIFGMSYWHNESPAWDSHTPYTLGLGYKFNDHFMVRYKHFSTGGTSSNNGGLDFITFGYNF